MRIEEKLKELKGPKVLVYLDDLLRMGRVREVLSVYPGVVEQFPEQAESLETIRQDALRKAEKLEKAAESGFEVSQRPCPACGATLRQHSTDAECLTCHYCGTRFQPGSEAAATKLFNPADHKPRSFIELGQVADLQGRKYQVVGRLRYRGRCREWDHEDDDWWTEPWTYDEWLLLGEDRSFLYLTEDEEGFTLAQGHQPTAPAPPDPNKRHFSLDKGVAPQPVSEHGDYRVVYFEGEFGWTPQVGESVQFTEYERAGLVFSVEARYAPGAQDPEEIEFFKAWPITRVALLRAFGREREALAEEAKAESKREYKRWGIAAAIAGAALLLIGLIDGSSGRLVMSEQFAFPLDESASLFGPVHLDEVGAVHRMVLRGSFADNSYAWFGVEMLDSEQNSINTIEGDFWRESGRDSEGHWSESDLSEVKHFHLDKAGEYYFRVLVEPGTAGSGSGQIDIREGVKLRRYYIVAALLLVGFGVALWRFRTTNPLYILVGLAVAGFLILKFMEQFSDD